MTDKIEVSCPDCGGTVRAALDDIAKQRTVRCTRGHSVKLIDRGGGARKAARALDDLDKSIKKLGR